MSPNGEKKYFLIHFHHHLGCSPRLLPRYGRSPAIFSHFQPKSSVVKDRIYQNVDGQENNIKTPFSSHRRAFNNNFKFFYFFFLFLFSLFSSFPSSLRFLPNNSSSPLVCSLLVDSLQLSKQRWFPSPCQFTMCFLASVLPSGYSPETLS